MKLGGQIFHRVKSPGVRALYKHVAWVPGSDPGGGSLETSEIPVLSEFMIS